MRVSAESVRLRENQRMSMRTDFERERLRTRMRERLRVEGSDRGRSGGSESQLQPGLCVGLVPENNLAFDGSCWLPANEAVHLDSRASQHGL